MDGISRDPEYAFKVLKAEALEYCELQFVWDKEIGEQTSEELKRLKKLADSYNIKVSCLTRHIFRGLNVLDVDVSSSSYRKQIDYLKYIMDIADLFNTRNVRCLTFNKQIITWGFNGAEQWNANNNAAWNKFIDLMREPAEMAEKRHHDIVIETVTNGMVTSGYLARKAIDDIGSPNVKALWDPMNSLFYADVPYPDAYDFLCGYIGEVHIKDGVVNIPQSTLQYRELGTGDMKPYLENIAAHLKNDYNGVVVLEGVYRPDGGTFEDGFHASLPLFKKLFSG
jgi:sugar phosphate isomerase/epimerase